MKLVARIRRQVARIQATSELKITARSDFDARFRRTESAKITIDMCSSRRQAPLAQILADEIIMTSLQLPYRSFYQSFWRSDDYRCHQRYHNVPIQVGVRSLTYISVDNLWKPKTKA